MITDIQNPQCDIEKLFNDFNLWYVWNYVNSGNFKIKDIASWLYFIEYRRMTDSMPDYIPDPYLTWRSFITEAHELCHIWLECKIIRVHSEYITCVLYEACNL